MDNLVGTAFEPDLADTFNFTSAQAAAQVYSAPLLESENIGVVGRSRAVA
jgi:hypothetical protein